MKRTIQYKNYYIHYILEIKPVKNINLHLNPNGQIYVSANEYVPVERIDRFVIEKIEWILDRQTKMMQRPIEKNQSCYSLLGKKYDVEFHAGSSRSVKLTDKVHVYGQDESEIEPLLEQFSRMQCEKLFPVMMKKAYDRMSLDYDLKPVNLKIRSMTSRWGSCMPTKNQITLNIRLIHYDIKFIEYVIWHEYAHLIQPNHSKAFYYVIEKYMPDYKQASKLYEKLPEELE